MIHRFVAAGLLLAGLSSTALASQGRNAGSLLVYPEFDNRHGTYTILTVTNVETAEKEEPIVAEFVYVGRYEGPNNDDNFCQEFNRREALTPADTFTCLTDVHNPQDDQGYVFIYAREFLGQPGGQPLAGDAIRHNFLTGNVVTIDGYRAFEFSVNPVSYLGINADNGDGDLLLDGNEYGRSPGEIVIPRFLGQNGMRQSELILLALSGGPLDDTTVDFLIFNDNEEIFSSEFTFRCWDRVYLTDISLLFENDFLADYTNDAMDEILGYSSVEAGWIHITGHLWGNSDMSYADPSIYAVLVERYGHLGVADLPFETGTDRDNGVLRAVVDN